MKVKYQGVMYERTAAAPNKLSAYFGLGNFGSTNTPAKQAKEIAAKATVLEPRIKTTCARRYENSKPQSTGNS